MAEGWACRMETLADSAFDGVRHARYTRACLAASCVAISRPRPTLAPVTMATLPERSGISATVHLSMVVVVVRVVSADVAEQVKVVFAFVVVVLKEGFDKVSTTG